MLDLTREADDTSLGAELLDEIYPGEDEAAQAKAAPAPAEEEEAAEAPLEEAGAGEVVLPVYEAAGDPAEGVFAGLLGGALIVLPLGASVVGGVLQGYLPSYGLWLSNYFWYFVPGAVVVAGLSTLVGWLVGKAGTPRRG